MLYSSTASGLVDIYFSLVKYKHFIYLSFFLFALVREGLGALLIRGRPLG